MRVPRLSVEFGTIILALALIGGGVSMILRPQPIAVWHVGESDGSPGRIDQMELVTQDTARWYGLAMAALGFGLVSVVIYGRRKGRK